MLKNLRVFQYIGGEAVEIIKEEEVREVLMRKIRKGDDESINDVATDLQRRGLNSSMCQRMDGKQWYIIIQESEAFEFLKLHELGHLELEHAYTCTENEMEADEYALERLPLEEQLKGLSLLTGFQRLPLVQKNQALMEMSQKRIDNARNYIANN